MKISILLIALLFSFPIAAMESSEKKAILNVKEMHEQEIDGKYLTSLSEALMTGEFRVTDDTIQFADYTDEAQHYVAKYKSAMKRVHQEFHCFVTDLRASEKNKKPLRVHEIHEKLITNPTAQLSDEDFKHFQLTRLMGFMMNFDMRDYKREQKKKLANDANTFKTEYQRLKNEIEDTLLNRASYKFALMSHDPAAINIERERKLHVGPFETFSTFMDKTRKGFMLVGLLGDANNPELASVALLAAVSNKGDCSLQ